MADEPSAPDPDPQDFTDDSPSPADDAELAVLCDALQEGGVTQVVVRYSGSGGSGCVDAVQYEPEAVALPAQIDAWLQNVAGRYCPGGYADDDGGSGCLTVYPSLGLAELEYRACYEDSEECDVGVADLPAELRQRLAALGVTQVAVHFDGYGDSGQVEEYDTRPEGVALGDELEVELEEFLLGQLPGGWEDNAGSFGDFTVDVAAGEVGVQARWRVEKESEEATTRWHWRR